MKKKHFIIILGQSGIIVLMAIYSFLQTKKVQVAERDALYQKEMAMAAQEEAQNQRKLADRAMEEAQRQNLRAAQALEKLASRK